MSSLPALSLSPQREEDRTYTRRPEWSRSMESLWAILAKWQFANRVPYSTLAAVALSSPSAEPAAGADLRTLAAFDLGSLSHHTGLARTSLARGACCGGGDSRLLSIASAWLRLCPACMRTGFHATLFQFTPIVRCPIHRVRLHDVCPHCKGHIAYRMTAAFAAHPLACPLCAHPFLPDPTVLAGRHRADLGDGPLSKWQHYLAHYAYWFTSGTVSRRDDAGRFLRAADRNIIGTDGAAHRLSFIARLQGVLDEPPPLPLVGSAAGAASLDVTDPASGAVHREPPFSRREWPHFHSRDFLGLFRRYACAQDRQQRLAHADDRRVTVFWRRTWEGAIARPCAVDDTFQDPPFGIAEWLAFARPPEHGASIGALIANLGERFEQDLHLTWTAWTRLLLQLGALGIEPSPRLVPPRACWLGSPAPKAEAPALGLR